MENYVVSNIDGAVATIEFFSSKGNSLPSFLLEKLEMEFSNIGRHEEVKVIILRSQGEKVFCAGASFDELSKLKTFEQAYDFFSGFGRVINAMRKCPKLIIGRIQGKVVGGGLGLVSACDYTVATEDASVRLSELSLGIGPYVISNAVERRIGKSAFAQMTLDTDWYDASWAFSKGLYNRLFKDIAEMDAYIVQLTSSLSLQSTDSLTEIKKLLWEGTESWDEILYEKAKISARLALSPPTQRKIRELLGKKKAD